MDNQDLTLERRRKAKDKLIAELLEALEIMVGLHWFNRNTKSLPGPDLPPTVIEAIRKAKGE